MTPSLFVEQSLNGVQLGVQLFLMSAGLTLVFGIMNLINLAHGSLYMAGAFFAATFFKVTGSFVLALALAIPATAVLGIIVEIVVLRRFYARSHLDQVLAFAVEIEGAPRPGDFVLWRFGHTFSHGAIVVAWPTIVHAYVGRPVETEDALRAAYLTHIGENTSDKGRPRPRRCFTLKQWVTA